MKYVVKKALPTLGICEGAIFSGGLCGKIYKVCYDTDNTHVSVSMSKGEFEQYFEEYVPKKKANEFGPWKDVQFSLSTFDSFFPLKIQMQFRTNGKKVELKGNVEGVDIAVSSSTCDGDEFDLEMGLSICEYRAMEQYAQKKLAILIGEK